MAYTSIGLAFSIEARAMAIEAHDYLSYYFHVESAMETVGALDKDLLELPKYNPGCPECMSNPIVQAKTLEEVQTDFNICIGMSIGQEALFF